MAILMTFVRAQRRSFYSLGILSVPRWTPQLTVLECKHKYKHKHKRVPVSTGQWPASVHASYANVHVNKQQNRTASFFQFRCQTL